MAEPIKSGGEGGRGGGGGRGFGRGPRRSRPTPEGGPDALTAGGEKAAELSEKVVFITGAAQAHSPIPARLCRSADENLYVRIFLTTIFSI